MQTMLLVLQQCSRGPATFVQHAGLAALEGPQDCVEEMRREYAGRREILAECEIPHAKFLMPEGGFFALLDISETGRSSEQVADYLLNECGVVAMPGSAYGEAGEGFLRVSFATAEETIRRGIDLIATGLARL
jgi:aspartate/methionine/tyrosine aminotransferase